MTVKVTQVPSNQAIDLDIKRFYIPGIELASPCPECGDEILYDLGNEYLSHPSANVPIDFYFYCDECSEEWHEQIVLRVTVEPAPEAA